MSSTGPWLRPLETEATPVLHTTSCGKDRFNTDFSALRSIEDRTHASSTSDSKRVSHPSTLLAQSSSTLVINCKLGPLVTSSGELMNNLRNCHLVWSGQVLPPGRVVKEVLQVSVVEAVVGRDVVGMPLLVVLGRTVLAAEHRRASLRQVRNKKTKNTKQTNFFPVSTKSAAIDRTPEKRMTALENLFSSFFREKQKRTCSGVSGASWLLTTVASAVSATAPTKPERKSRFVVSILVSAVGDSCRRCNVGFGKTRWQVWTGNLRRSEEAAWAPKNS